VVVAENTQEAERVVITVYEPDRAQWKPVSGIEKNEVLHL